MIGWIDGGAGASGDMLLGALVRDPTLFATSATIRSSVPASNGPSVLPFLSSGISFTKSASTPTTCHFTKDRVACSPPFCA